MKRLIALFAASLLLMSGPQVVWAQATSKVVGTCGTATYTAGTMQYPTQDTTGAACSSGGGGGGGGVVTQPTPGNLQTLDNGAVTTAAPTYTTGTNQPLSLDTSGNLRVISSGSAGTQAVNITQVAGAAPSLTNPIFTANAEAADTTGTFTNATQTTSVTNSAADGYATGLISINGTYATASGVFEASDDAGVTFYSINCNRSDGSGTETGYTALMNTSRQWTCPVGGNDSLRIRSTAVASGTVNARVGVSAPTPTSSTATPVPLSYTLLSNGAASGGTITNIVGGGYIFGVAGTFGGTTAQLQVTDASGTLQNVSGASCTAACSIAVNITPGSSAKITLTGGSPSGIFSVLGGLGGPAGSSLSGTTSNASSGVGTSATNLATVAYSYCWNGTTWDQCVQATPSFGFTSVVTATHSTVPTAYSSGTTCCQWWNVASSATYYTFTNVCRINGGYASIDSITVTDTANPTTSLMVDTLFFSSAPGATTWTDYGLANLNAADVPRQDNGVQPMTLAPNGTSQYFHADGLGQVVQCVSGTTSVYAGFKVRNNYVPASSEAIVVTIKGHALN